MKITDVRYRRLDFGPRDEPVRNAHLTFDRLNATVIEVATDEGITGLAITGGRAAFGLRQYVEGPLRDAVVGEDPFTVARLWDQMMGGWRKPWTRGEVVASLSGVDTAIWDVIGKALNQPLYRLLGGYRDVVPVYAAGGYYPPSRKVEDLVDEVRSYLDKGYRKVKIKVGGGTLAEDVERVGAVRQLIGEDLDLMLDANYAWRASDAIEAVRELRQFRPFWIEEPTHPDDVRGLARVRAEGGVPTASGENEFTRFGSLRLLEADSVDILQVDANIGGGVTEWMRVAALASAYHVPMCPHGDPIVHAHLVAATENGMLVESYPKLYHYMGPLVGELTIVDGMMQMPEGPGLGVELDWDYVEKHTVQT